MGWTIYNLSDGAVLVNNWPVDPSGPDSEFAWDAEAHGCVETSAADLLTELWDPVALSWAPNLPLLRERRWEEAKAYRAQRQAEPLPVPSIVDGDIIIAQRDAEGQAWIDRMSAAATGAVVTDQALVITFTDFANRPFTINAQQILQLGAASLAQQAACHVASQAVRAALDSATTPEEIAAVDITAGYPAQS